MTLCKYIRALLQTYCTLLQDQSLLTINYIVMLTVLYSRCSCKLLVKEYVYDWQTIDETYVDTVLVRNSSILLITQTTFPLLLKFIDYIPYVFAICCQYNKTYEACLPIQYSSLRVSKSYASMIAIFQYDQLISKYLAHLLDISLATAA